jgi:hypothetical protein
MNSLFDNDARIFQKEEKMKSFMYFLISLLITMPVANAQERDGEDCAWQQIPPNTTELTYLFDSCSGSIDAAGYYVHMGAWGKERDTITNTHAMGCVFVDDYPEKYVWVDWPSGDDYEEDSEYSMTGYQGQRYYCECEIYSSEENNFAGAHICWRNQDFSTCNWQSK